MTIGIILLYYYYLRLSMISCWLLIVMYCSVIYLTKLYLRCAIVAQDTCTERLLM